MTSFGRAFWTLFLSVLGATAAASCAAGNEKPPSSSEGGGGTDDNPSASSSVSSSASSGSGGAGGMGGQGGGGGGGGSGGGGGGATSAVEPSVVTLSSLYMNCMPGAMPSVEGSFDVKYDNMASMSPALPKVTGAKLAMTYLGSSYEWSFAVTPESTIVPAGNAPVVKHTAGAGSGMGTGQLCDYCAGVWTLTVTWDVGGKALSSMKGPQPFDCVL